MLSTINATCSRRISAADPDALIAGSRRAGILVAQLTAMRSP
jgi:hypothetical protein